jgi:hypothetical protein
MPDLLGGFYVDQHDRLLDYHSPAITHPNREEAQNRGTTHQTWIRQSIQCFGRGGTEHHARPRPVAQA